MRTRRSLAVVVALAILLAAGPAEAGRKDGTSTDVETYSTDSSVTVKVGSTYGGLQLVQADPLAGCSFFGPATGAHVRELMKVGPGPMTIGARVAKLEDDVLYGVVKCDRVRFEGMGDAVWPIDENPPPGVVEAVVVSAISRLAIPTPTPQTAPDGNTTPFLVHLPVWLWVDETAWAAQVASADLGPLNVSATATASPAHTLWSAGDGTEQTRCDDGGTPWHRDLNDNDATCAITYEDTTKPGVTIELEATVVYALSVSCNPARLCDGIDVPSVLQASASRPVRVTEVVGLLTG